MSKRNLFLIILCTIFVFILIFMVNLNLTSVRFYKQGLNFEQKKDFQNAYYNFGKIPFTSKLYPLAIYKKAKCASNLNDKKTALKNYKKYNKVMKDPLLKPVGLFEEANLELDFNHIERAKKIYEKIQKKYPKSDFYHAANYKLGAIIIEKNKGQEKKNNKNFEENSKIAKDYLIKYLEYAPIGRYSDASIKYLETNKFLTNKDRQIIAISYFKKNNFNKSIYYLNQIQFPLSWYYLAKNYEKTGNFLVAQNTYLKGLITSSANLTNIQIQDAIDSYTRLSSADKLSELRNIMILTNEKSPVRPIAMYNYAKNLPLKYGIQVFSELYTKYRENYLAKSALSEIILYNFKNRNYDFAINLGENNENLEAKGLYYLAKSYEAKANRAQAFTTYKKIIEKFPDGYYAFRANSNLTNRKISFKADKNLVLKPQKNIDFPYKNSKYLNILVNLGDFEAIDDFKITNGETGGAISSYIAYKKGRRAYSQLVARDTIDAIENKKNISKSLFYLAYPIYYEDAINKYAKQNGLSPYLMIALIKEESHFDKNAKSKTGAMGLTQIMPATAKMMAGANFCSSCLNQINYNIMLGFKYFSSIKNQLSGSELFAVSGYNAGPNAVKAWLSSTSNNGAVMQNATNFDVDLFVEEIPYLETRDYVKKVYGSYWNYLRNYK